MQLSRARQLARGLMDRHGLEDWEFGFDSAKRRLGACWLERRRITLSRHFVGLNEEELVRDVVLHEIAHALTPGDGHGAAFRRKAAELGCRPGACRSTVDAVPPPARYILECPHCGRTWQRYRRPNRSLVCRPCAERERSRVRPLVVRTAA